MLDELDEVRRPPGRRSDDDEPLAALALAAAIMGSVFLSMVWGAAWGQAPEIVAPAAPTPVAQTPPDGKAADAAVRLVPRVRTYDLGSHDVGALVVPHLGAVHGRGVGLTELVGSITSEHFEELAAAGKAQWASDGAVERVELRDFALAGPGGVNDNPHLWDVAKPATAFGVRLFATGAVLEGLSIDGVPGDGVTLLRGTNPRQGNLQAGDVEETRVRDLTVRRCFRGLVIDGAHSDGLVSDSTVSVVRDDAVYVGASAGHWTFTACHTWGAGGRAWALFGRSTLVGCQGESSGVGTYVAPSAAGTILRAHRTYICREAGLVLAGATDADGVFQAARGAAVRVEATASGSSVRGAVALEGEALGVVVDADKTVVDARCWGGATQVIVGATRPVNGCTIDVTVGGAPVGVEVRNLGRGNRIRVYSDGQCARPLVLPARPVHASNRVDLVEVGR